MKYHTLTLDLSAVETVENLYDSFKNTFGFSDFYEKSTRSLISHLSSLRQPEDGMSKFVLSSKQEVLILELKGLSEKNKGLIQNFALIIEAVNYKEVCRGRNSLILLNLVEF